MKSPNPRYLSAAALATLLSTALVTSAAAPAGRYTTSAGVVYDTKTKLTWQQTVPASAYSWSAAKTYCTGLSLNGTGWRLPTVKELQTLVDYSRSTLPFIDPTAFPNTPSTYFWSATPVAGSPSSAWGVGFEVGYTYKSGTGSGTGYVRCVY